VTSMTADARRPTATRLVARFGDTLWYLASVCLLLAVWELIGIVLRPSFLPPLTDVVVRLVDEFSSGELTGFLVSSLANFSIGFSIAALGGLAIGVLMGTWKPWEVALSPYVYAMMTAPSIVFAPVFFAMFGLSRWSIVALIVQYAIFIVIINTMTAVKQVRSDLKDMARSFGAARWQVTWHVVVRAALPLSMTGVRLGLGRSVKGMINGELLIALIGLGGLIDRFGNRFDAEGVLALVLLIVICSLVLLRVFGILDRRLNGWVDR
jgi:ABC-type nitrate/sulfonate/bicarbonate transport system permease component